MNTIEPSTDAVEDSQYNIYYRRALKYRLEHRRRMIELAVRTELYKQENNRNQSRLSELEDEITHLSTKWADDAVVIKTLQKSAKVSSWPQI